jgi:hypothetical protein
MRPISIARLAVTIGLYKWGGLPSNLASVSHGECRIGTSN